MTEPQRLDYSVHRQSNKPAIIIKFNEHTEPVTFNVDMVCLYFFLTIIISLCQQFLTSVKPLLGLG